MKRVLIILLIPLLIVSSACTVLSYTPRPKPASSFCTITSRNGDIYFSGWSRWWEGTQPEGAAQAEINLGLRKWTGGYGQCGYSEATKKTSLSSKIIMDGKGGKLVEYSFGAYMPIESFGNCWSSAVANSPDKYIFNVHMSASAEAEREGITYNLCDVTIYQALDTGKESFVRKDLENYIGQYKSGREWDFCVDYYMRIKEWPQVWSWNDKNYLMCEEGRVLTGGDLEQAVQNGVIPESVKTNIEQEISVESGRSLYTVQFGKDGEGIDDQWILIIVIGALFFIVLLKRR